MAANFTFPNYLKSNILFIDEISPKPILFKNLIILKGMFESITIQVRIHDHLLTQLYTSSGFSSLVLNICNNKNEQIPSWKQSAIVANIIKKTIKKETTNFMLDEILNFHYILCNEQDLQNHLISACITTLNTIYVKFPNEIISKFTEKLEKISNPAELVAGHILFHQQELYCFLNQLWNCFGNSSSSNELLPSIILYPYILVLLVLYKKTPTQLQREHNYLKLIILRILNNRTLDELKILVEKCMNGDNSRLHEKIDFKENIAKKEYILQIVRLTNGSDGNITSSLLDIFKSSSNNVLFHKFFLLFLNNLIEKPTLPILQKCEIIHFLTELVSDKNYCSYLSSHPEELLLFLEHLIENSLKNIDDNIQNLQLLLSIVNELYSLHDFIDQHQNLIKLLEMLSKSPICKDNKELK